ncbi:hypothetical protein AB0E78_02605 [Streptomyces sp. NPDC032198]|uniref:pentapeptide repeat-containing protein n=1 Tax=Streptomyces sp. NPDC032198 TaxID=3155127 RepID=UPI0033F03D27
MSFYKRRPRQLGSHTPNLWPVWLVAPLALVLVATFAYGLYQGADALLTSANTGKKPVKVQDVIKTTVTVLTLTGAVLAGLYAYRKQLLDEGASHRADATQLAERYTAAAEQLGHDQPAVRLAGVYAMARLADDWPEQRQVCIDVLCAYLRMPYAPDGAEEGFRKGEREVRLTIIRIISAHLQDPTKSATWCGYDLNFTGAVFDGGDFTGSFFSGGTVSFAHATFSGGTVFFTGSKFVGGTTSFTDSNFTGGTLAFLNSTFSGGSVYFTRSTLSDGTISFANATFSGAKVVLSYTRFTGGSVFFVESKFSGGKVFFTGSPFSGSRVSFANAAFSGGTVFFTDSTFSRGTITFTNATLSGGDVQFPNVRVRAAAVTDWGPFPAIPIS